MAEANKSYRQIIKSTSIFGGSQVITVVLGIVRNKVLAILLGASGIGLISIYQNILDLVKSVSTLGIETGGVREIASADPTGEDDRVLNISLIDRITLILAVFGAFICIVVSYPVALWAFGSAAYVWHILLLSVCVFFSILAAGQTVVLHGLRQIGSMVKSAVAGSFIGLVVTLPLYYFFREKAVIPAFIIVSLVAYIAALHYRKKLGIKTVPVTLSQVSEKGKSIFRLGFYIVISSALTMFGYFLVRTFLSNNMGLQAVGLYQAVWSVTGVGLMLILKSMGSDFYPRLCAIIGDNKSSIRLINEQTYVVLIISVPLIILLLLFSKTILSLLYSSEFTVAASMMNWQLLGTFFKVLSWPLGFILLAKGKGRLYFFSETVFLVVYLLLIYLLYNQFSFEAAGIAYMAAYAVYLFTVFVLGRSLSDFGWTKENVGIGFISLIQVLLAFLIVQFCGEYAIIAGIPLLIVSALYSLFKLNKVFPVQSLSDFFKNR